MRTANIKSDRPSVAEALSRLERELKLSRWQGEVALKIVHGYGSSGVGGEIRVAVQRRLVEMAHVGEIKACIFGEEWAKSNEYAWGLLQAKPELKADPDLGRGNPGISIVLLA